MSGTLGSEKCTHFSGIPSLRQYQAPSERLLTDWKNEWCSGLQNWMRFSPGTQVGSLGLCGFLLSCEFAPVISHANLRGLVHLMGGDLVKQRKEGQ